MATPFKCIVCGEEFAYMKPRDRHEILVHNLRQEFNFELIADSLTMGNFGGSISK